MTRFIPKKRIALDNKQYWLVFDNKTNDFSTFVGDFNCYKTKKECQIHILVVKKDNSTI